MSGSAKGIENGAGPEAALRARLGVPSDAARVLVFSESSHWDTNWLQTSEEYFRGRLEPIFAAIMAALERDPARIYGVESVFFLKLYWERHPEHQERLARLIERRQLRILSSSFTTPDTLLPHPEALLRDYHLGQEWLEKSGLSIVPRTAYFPDNFGHSPHLPSLMRAVGVDSVAVTRIDGMYFIAADYRSKRAFPLKGSTAELLQKDLKTLDFVWRDDGGDEVLCHWNAFTYFQGDMLAHTGIVRWNGHCAAIPWRTRGHVARRIDGFVRQLAPLARTPYMLCPIGMDFNDPIDGLRELLDRYNRERFAATGTWAVLAGLDDYFDLVGAHRVKLPTLSVDPNPYWMGFYSSRPDLKQRPTRIARSLVLAESLSALTPPDAALEASLREAWERLVLMNHHDAITGTSPDRVCHEEQRGWLDEAEAAATRALSLASAGTTMRSGPLATGVARAPERIQWWRDGRDVRVRTSRLEACFSKARGGCLTSLVVDGREQLDGLGLDLLAFSDDGGLWRLGHEYRGGSFREVDRASRRPARVQVLEEADAVRVLVTSDLRGETFTRSVTCPADEPFVTVRVSGRAPRRTTVTCRSAIAGRDGPLSLSMDTIGGTIERPHERIHQPTFWPVPSVISLRAPARALHVGFEAPTAASFSPDTGLEWIVARNASKERAFGVLPVLAHPIGGTSDEVQTHEAAIFAAADPELTAAMRRRLDLAWLPPAHRALKHLAGSFVRCDDPAISFAATKRADVGAGIIVRLASPQSFARTVRVWLSTSEIGAASRCDACERDLGPLEVDGGHALVPLASRLTTIRLVVRRGADGTATLASA